MSFTWPETRPADDADFTTPKKGEFVGGKPLAEHTYVEAKAVACRLSASQGGSGGADQVDVAYLACPKQYALKEGDHTLSDVGGETVLQTASFNGGAYDITMKALARSGFDPARAFDAYVTKGKDPKALAMCQQMRALDPNTTADQLHQAMGMLALQRGDLAACGLGSKPIRLTVANDTFKEVTRRRVGFINAIPAPATEDDVMKLVRGLPKPGAAGPGRIAPPARGTTAAPAAGGKPNDDDVNF